MITVGEVVTGGVAGEPIVEPVVVGATDADGAPDPVGAAVGSGAAEDGAAPKDTAAPSSAGT